MAKIKKPLSGNYITTKAADEIFEQIDNLDVSKDFKEGAAFLLDFLTESREDALNLTIPEFKQCIEDFMDEFFEDLITKPIKDLIEMLNVDLKDGGK